MPQPIPSSKTISFDFRRNAVLQRPELAARIAAILSHWNEIESRIALFMAALMGGEAKTIVNVYLAIQSDGAKKATIDTVTELKLPLARLAEFREIQKDIGSRYAERNKAVHGSWGISPEYPDSLLWYDPRDTVALFPELMERLDGSQLAERQKLVAEQRARLRIYTKTDLTDIIGRFEVTYSALEAFTTPFIAPLFDKMTI